MKKIKIEHEIIPNHVKSIQCPNEVDTQELHKFTLTSDGQITTLDFDLQITLNCNISLGQGGSVRNNQIILIEKGNSSQEISFWTKTCNDFSPSCYCPCCDTTLVESISINNIISNYIFEIDGLSIITQTSEEEKVNKGGDLLTSKKKNSCIKRFFKKIFKK